MCHAARPSRSGTYPIEPHRASVFSHYASFFPIRGQNSSVPNEFGFLLSALCLSHAGGGSGGGDMRHAQSRLKKASQERAWLTLPGPHGHGLPACCRESLEPLSPLLTLQARLWGAAVGNAVRRALGRFLPPLCSTHSDLGFCLDDLRDNDVWTGPGGGMWSTVGRGGVR